MDDYDIGLAFKKIEDELIASMIRNIERHAAEETGEGYNWTMWQTEQLKALEIYRRSNLKKFSPQFQVINSSIERALKVAKNDGRLKQEASILRAMKKGLKVRKSDKGATAEFFHVNERKLNALIESTTSDMQKAETAVLRYANDQYRKIIFNAQVYANTGAGTYKKAVDMATKDFLRAGINCIEYKNGSRHTIAEYADMAIRTASKRAYLQGEGEMRKEWGISTVIMNKRGNPCPKCLPFVGKVMIDDVWSGGKSTDGPYMLMSTAISKGLYHPRCKDSHTTYFPGISSEGVPYTEEEKHQVADRYNAEQKQQYAKNQAEKFRRMAEYSLDEDNKRVYAARKEQWEKQTSGRIREANDVTDEYIKKRKPGIGSILYEDGVKEEDKTIVDWLYHSFGGNIKCLKEDSKIGKMPDAIWDDIYWEFKAPSSKNSIDERLRKARIQITEALERDGKEYLKCGIVLDITNRKISLEECIKCVEDRAPDRCLNNTDIIIKDKNDIVKILRVKK